MTDRVGDNRPAIVERLLHDAQALEALYQQHAERHETQGLRPVIERAWNAAQELAEAHDALVSHRQETADVSKRRVELIDNPVLRQVRDLLEREMDDSGGRLTRI